MWDRLKKALRWVYDWITVLTGLLVGVPELLLQLLSAFDGVDISPIFGPDRALKIMTGVAIVKAALSFIESRVKAD